VYLERRIVAAIHGEPERDFSAIIGWKALGTVCPRSTKQISVLQANFDIEDSVSLYLEQGKPEFTQLIIDHKGIDPDDAFSTVPYEKGFHFLYYLEKLVGRDNFDKFIPHYFEKFAEKSLDSFEFKETFLEFFNKLGDEAVKEKLKEIDWQGRFYNPGLPPKPDFDTSYADVCYALTEKWKDPVRLPSHRKGPEMTRRR
jgi:leukotriene-A4 hydrolase